MEAGLTGLIQALRAAHFSVGPSEAIAAARLLVHLQSRGDAAADPKAWRLWLRPVLCSNREEQQRFDALYADWVQALEHRRQQREHDAAPGGGRDGAELSPGSVAGAAGREWWTQIGTWVGAALGLVIVVVVLLSSWTPTKPPPEPPVQSPVTTAAPDASTPDRATDETHGPTPGLRSSGFAPAWREARSLRPEILLPLLLLPPLLAWLIGGAQPLALWRGRRRSGRSVVLDTRTLEDQARAMLPPLDPGVAGRLQRHLRADSAAGAPLARRRRIDERKTVEALLHRPGELRLRHRPAPLRPSYLVLVDAQDDDDPRGRLFVNWAERLRREGLDVQVRTFRHADDAEDAPRSRSLGARAAEAELPLDRLPDPSAGQRLVVVGETPAWVTADGAWRPWYRRARLHRWPVRAFFTPTELRDWGERESAIERAEGTADPGFMTLPMDETALEAWSVLVASGWLPAFSLSEPQRYPRLLSRDGFDPFALPDAGQREALVAQLMLYLGDTGFRWLCMLCVPPLVRWELTLLLGRALVESAPGVDPAEAPVVFGRAYRRLTRLPWLRGMTVAGRGVQTPGLPDWLRLRLLDELPPVAADDVRERVDTLLSTLHEGPGTLELGLEAPPPRQPGTAATPRGDAADALYLGVLSGLMPRQLAQRVPDPWRAWLRPRHALPARGWRQRWQRHTAEAGDWLQTHWARLAFRDGLPWAERNPAAWIVAAMALLLIGITLSRLVALEPAKLAPTLERAFFSHRLMPVEVPLAAGARAATLAPDGLSAALLGRDGRIHMADTASGRVLRSFGDAAFADHLRFDGERVTACASGPAPGAPAEAARAWQVDGKAVDTTPAAGCAVEREWRDPMGALLRFDEAVVGRVGLKSPILAVAFNRDGRVAAQGDVDGRIRLWHLPATNEGTAKPEAAGTLALGPSAVLALSLSDDGDRLLSVQADGRVRLSLAWQPALGETTAPAWLVALSADGRTLASSGAAGRVVVQRVADGQVVAELAGRNTLPLLYLALAPDGSRIALLDPEGVASVGPTGPIDPTGQLSNPVPTPLQLTEVRALAWLADGRLRLVNAAGEIFDLPRGQTVDAIASVGKLPDPGGDFNWVVAHPTGLVAAVVRARGARSDFVTWRSSDGATGTSGDPVDADGPLNPLVIGSQGRSLWWTPSSGGAQGIRFGRDPAPIEPWPARAGSRVAAFDDDRGRLARLDRGRLDFVDVGGGAAAAPRGRATELRAVRALPGRRWLVVHDDGEMRIEDPARELPWPVMALAPEPGPPVVALNGSAVVVTQRRVRRDGPAPAAAAAPPVPVSTTDVRRVADAPTKQTRPLPPAPSVQKQQQQKLEPPATAADPAALQVTSVADAPARWWALPAAAWGEAPAPAPRAFDALWGVLLILSPLIFLLHRGWVRRRRARWIRARTSLRGAPEVAAP